jgi:phage shock protein A
MPSLFSRVRELVTAQAHHTIDTVENPQVMAQQVLRDLTQDVHDVQRALVVALGAAKQLQHQQEQLLAEAAQWEGKAERLLPGGDEALARGALEKVVTSRAAATALDKPLATARRSAERMREQLAQLKSEWQSARNRCAQISANQAAAEAVGVATRATDQYTAAMDRAAKLDRLSSKSARFEAEMDAASELLADQDRFERDVARADRTAEVDAAMQTLKAKMGRAS